MRAFVAVLLHTPELARLIEELRGLRHAKPVSPEGTHVTLKFLGEVPESAVGGICSALEAALAGVRGFRAELRGVGAFPSPSSPRVVWAAAEPEQAFAELHSRVEKALVALGFSKERRAFKPHVTLARMKGRSRGVREFLARHADAELGSVEVREVHLMRSTLTPAGARYSQVCRVSLL
ncbi:MAG: RNA 2',3'-cyclic phosphodiesterase [Euryarchaeota archaeon]|nr:RNA 2',3'-cyclic phosphodiesterase [Euryarchaeota archaeon]